MSVAAWGWARKLLHFDSPSHGSVTRAVTFPQNPAAIDFYATNVRERSLGAYLSHRQRLVAL